MKTIFSLNQGWKFCRAEDIFYGVPADFFDSIRANTKTGLTSGPKNANFYDKHWQTVDLPHDWVIRCDPLFEHGRGQGHRPHGAAWYRKHFTLDPAWEGKRIFVKLEGASASAEVYFNSIKVGILHGGYTPICIDVTDFVAFDKNNTIAVRTEIIDKEGWWYEGGGLYRNTWLIVAEDARFADDGVFVSSRNNHDGTWTIDISAETIDAEGCLVQADFHGKTVSAPAEACTRLTLQAENPALWDHEHPNLHDVTVTLLKDGEAMDEEVVKTGFREIVFDAQKGFFINGKPEKLRGVCLHHDHAGVGVAVDKSILLYRLKKLKEMGCNAIRTSHNPQSVPFYEACNELGFYVMNEVRHFSSTEICLKELELFVRRDRNHPCVVMWSLFNEEPLQCSKTGEKIIASMLKVLRKHDPTRPTTGGMNGPIELRGVVNYVDVMGFNYLQYGYDEFHKLYPDMPIIGSETGSYMSSRDEFQSNRETSRVACYTRKLLENLYYWSDTPGGTWKYICDRPFVAGGFYWTGIDYHGENCPFLWPSVTSNFGAMDICCFPKDCYYWHKALWTSEPCLEITRPWEGRPGEALDIVCYSNCETIELILNGRTVFSGANDVYDPQTHSIPYEDGVLQAIGYIGGSAVCRKEIRTYGRSRSLEIAVSEKQIRASDSVIIDVYQKDEYGQLVKIDDRDVTIRITNGHLIGSANGDCSSHRDTLSDVQTLYHGCAQFIVRPDGPGTLSVKICSEIGEADCGITVFAAQRQAIDAVPFRSYANHHMMSDVHPTYPNEKERRSTVYAWIPTMIGVEKSLMMSGKTGYALIRNDLDMPKENTDPKTMVVEKITGNFDIYCGEELVYSSGGFFSGDVSLDVSHVKNFHPVVVVFSLSGEECGIAGNLYIDFSS